MASGVARLRGCFISACDYDSLVIPQEAALVANSMQETHCGLVLRILRTLAEDIQLFRDHMTDERKRQLTKALTNESALILSNLKQLIFQQMQSIHQVSPAVLAYACWQVLKL